MNVTLYGHDYTLSGVAPGALLMNYRFDKNKDGFDNFLIDSISLDNPDILSNSWGPTPIENSENENFKTLVIYLNFIIRIT